jgi:Uma2 family endonuclease
MSLSASAHHTWDDFVMLEEDDLRELIDGELVEVEVPTFRHEEIVSTLSFFLRSWIERGNGGRVIASG